jgi:hypothetical protein
MPKHVVFIDYFQIAHEVRKSQLLGTSGHGLPDQVGQ